jgi:hypothetical protein
MHNTAPPCVPRSRCCIEPENAWLKCRLRTRVCCFSRNPTSRPPNVYFLFGDIRDLGANTNRWGVQRVCADILEYVVLQGMYHASPGISG